MKKSSIIIATVFLFAVSTSFQSIIAQEKSKEEKEKELQEVIVEQKKAMIDQQKAFDEQQKVQEEVQKALNESQVEVREALEKARIKIDDPEFRRSMKIYEDMGRTKMFSPDEPFVFAAPNVDVFYHNSHTDAERTTWDFSKSIKESSFSKDYVFDVEPTAKSVIMSVSGDCKAGEIRIRIMMPNGKQFSEIILDEFGNLNWRKSITISETENKDKTGNWKFEIKSSKASGYFKIFFQTS
jgi:hypothetical protein